MILISAPLVYIFLKKFIRSCRWIRPNLFSPGKSSKISKVVDSSLEDMIGNTSMIRLKTLSTDSVQIYAKCEFENPGGSPKDRVAQSILDGFEKRGLIQPGDQVVEATVGSTGIALAWICRLRGYKCLIFMPSDVSKEKKTQVEALGAEVKMVPPASISHPQNFINCAKRYVQERQYRNFGIKNAVFADQFENMDNFYAHYNGTAEEILDQICDMPAMNHYYMVVGAGTGGSLAGLCRKLKPKLKNNIKFILADPQGSTLHNRVNSGVMYSREYAEGKRRMHQVDSIVEGIGQQRMTSCLDLVIGESSKIANIDEAVESAQCGVITKVSSATNFNWIDASIRVTDREAVLMSRYLARNEGLFLGSSSSVNICASLKLAKLLEQTGIADKVCILTLACDQGTRYLSSFWNNSHLAKENITSNHKASEEVLLSEKESESKEFWCWVDQLGFLKT